MTTEQDSRTDEFGEQTPGANDDAADINTAAPCDDRAEADKPVDTGPRRQTRYGMVGRRLYRRLAVPQPILLTLLVTGTAVVAAFVFFLQYRPYQQTTDRVGRDALKAASEGTVAILSYSPDTLEHDFTAAKERLTGDFLAYYDRFTHQIVAPAAKQAHVQTTASVVRAAVSELHQNSAVVLTFVNQAITSKDKREPISTTSAVRVGLTKVNGSWLISSFDPI
jgi:Mce-associated membrane protein